MDVADMTPERWDDLAEVFGTRGDPSRCWCQFFLGAPDEDRTAEQNKAALRSQLSREGPLGVLAYRDGEPAGWCGIAPRARYPRLARARVAQATSDQDGLWSVTCFVVRPGHRRQGVATALLGGALDLARRRGARVIEAYPVDPTVRKPSSAALYWGPLPLYLAAGFTEVARPTDARAVVRLEL